MAIVTSLIPEAALAELWFSFRLKAWRSLKSLISKAKDDGIDQKEIAERLGMDAGQLSRTLSGRQAVTLRSMFRIARAIGLRMEITFVPLKGLKAPNYALPKIQIPALVDDTAMSTIGASAQWSGVAGTTTADAALQAKFEVTNG